jgi:hypothetical protein
MRAIRLLRAALAVLPAVAAPSPHSTPLVITPNRGQAPREARFVAKTARLNVYFRERETVLQMGGGQLRVEFLDATGPRAVEPEHGGSGVANFLIGPEEQWVTGVPVLAGVAYREIYPGIDAVYRGSGSDLKSEYVVQPGSDPAHIRLRYTGADRLTVEPDGSLAIDVGRQRLRESPPALYQQRGEARLRVEGAFQVNGDVVSFAVGGYDRSLPLTIDPVLSYLTLLGGSGTDAAASLAVDAAGAAYVAGFTSSYDLPTANPAQSSNGGGNDVFVAKLAASGSSLVYCTYLGGRGDDRAYGIAVDSTGAAYVTGSTMSSNFPVRGALQPKLAGGRNAFVLKLAPAGNALVYSTYLGGSGSDTAYGIAVDAAGSAYVTGDTTSLTFPATAFQKSNRGAPDAFVAKVTADGSRLVYSTYLGGSGEDHASAIAVDGSGAAVVAGSTYSPDFPVASAYQASLGGGQDAFVTKLAADGNSLVFSTYLGGSGGMLGAAEAARAVALDTAGNVYVAGETGSVNFPIRGALQASNAGWQDGFVSRFGPSGTLIYSTYLGGVNLDGVNAIAVDGSGCAYVAGQTTSAVLSGVVVSQAAPSGVPDVFVMKLTAAADAIAATSYFGGVGADTATAVALDTSASLYVAGWTQSPNFVVVNGFQSVNGGNYGAFVGKLSFTAAAVNVTVAPASPTLVRGATQQFSATVSGGSTSAVTWSINPVVGTISTTGLYTAPATLASTQTVTVRATSAADPTKSATASVTLAAVTVAVSPASVTLNASQTQQFSATVSNSGNTGVTWSISPVVGTMSTTGLYTAPASVTSQQTITITATSVADPTKSSTATVSLSPGSVSSDLALGKTATQSSTVAPASRAVDGNTDGDYWNGSVSHTGADANAWWQVDLGASYSINAVTLWNRTDCCGDRLSDYWVFVSDTPFASTDTPATLQSRTATWGAHQTTAPAPSATVTPNSQGRYVRVQLAGTNNLQLGEVQVYGSTPGVAVAPATATLGPGATQQFTATIAGSPGAAVNWSLSPALGSISAAGVYSAPATVAAVQTVVITATASADPSKSASATVSLRMTGTLANLALGKPVSQSSTMGVGAAAAVDGNTDGNYWDGSVSQTNSEISPWWQVDLGAAAEVGSVTIWNRTDCCVSRLNDYWIFVSATPFNASDTPAVLQTRAGVWSTHQTTAPDPSGTLAIGARGRYVRIQLSGTNALHMAEVQVFGAWVTDNIAIGNTASQSTTWSPASRAVDGNTDGVYWDNSVTETAPAANAWWQVDLGAAAGVGSVAIWNRTDCCADRLSDYWVFVSNTPFASTDTPATLQGRAGTWSVHQTTAPNPAVVIPVAAPGRYVRVQLSGTNNLHMAEVEVFGAFQ